MLPRELLRSVAGEWGIGISDAQLDRFDRYAHELLRWNRHTNLTSIVEPREIAVRHMLDSLSLARLWPGDGPASLVDIGSGAGFPGLALKIVWPATRVLLVESVGKKAEFLRYVAAELGLDNVEVSAVRAEAVGRDPRYRERFAFATGRAVAALSVLAEYCLPLAEVGGMFAAPRGSDAATELAASAAALLLLGGGEPELRKVILPGVEPRGVVVVRKLRSTNERYPRRTGVPAQRPL